MTITEIQNEDAWAHFSASVPHGRFALVFFYTPWAASCPQVDQVLRTLAQDPSLAGASWASLNAEDLATVSETLGVTAVPVVVALRDGQVVSRIGGSSLNIRDGIENLLRNTAAPPSGSSAPLQPLPAQPLAPASLAPSNDGAATKNATATAEQLTASDGDLHRLVNASPVMLFMKGTPNAPQCGFSKQTVSLLRERGVKYGFFNVLSDDAIRQNLKTFADWPTYPQLWVKGELIGGLDIVKEHFSTDPGFLVDTM